MEETRENGFDAKTVDLEDFSPEELAETPRAVFLMATYGEGEPTDNATRFLSWLKNADGAVSGDFLNKTNYFVFGLGNTQYDHYNKMGIDADAMLATLGAKRLMEIGLGDDNSTLEEDFDQWKQKFMASLMVKYHPHAADMGFTQEKLAALLGGEGGGTAESELKLPGKVHCSYSAMFLEGAAASAQPNLNPDNLNTSTKHFFTAPEARVVVSRELRSVPKGKKAADIGSTRHIEVDLDSTGLEYDTADNLAILPHNGSNVVDAVASALGYDLDAVFELRALEGESAPKACFPTPCSVRQLLTHYLDLKGAPRQSELLKLYPYLQNPAQQAWLAELLAKSNKEGYKEFMRRTYSSFADLVCGELSSAQIPLSDLLHILPFVQPRFYTIASSSSEHPTCVHLTIATSEVPIPAATSGNKTLKGLCSGFVETLSPLKDSMRIFIRSSSFRLPADIATPIIMIGPGTGIAPMRALLQERYYQSIYGPTQASDANDPNRRRTRSTSIDFRKNKEDASMNKAAESGFHVGSNTLYFGCKNSKQDFIYKDELVDYRDNKKILTKLHLAFSREDPKKKVYVQHLLAEEENAKALIADLDKGGCIYVCGATAMGADVMEAIEAILVQHKSADGITSAEKAKAYIETLHNSGRYVQELWSA